MNQTEKYHALVDLARRARKELEGVLKRYLEEASEKSLIHVNITFSLAWFGGQIYHHILGRSWITDTEMSKEKQKRRRVV